MLISTKETEVTGLSETLIPCDKEHYYLYNLYQNRDYM